MSEKKCWNCGGMMTKKKDDAGRPYWECWNPDCKATDTDIVNVKLGTTAKLNPERNIGEQTETKSVVHPVRKKKVS